MKKFAFVFPGQGSQTVNMLADIATEFPEVNKTFSEASSVLGYDLWTLVEHGPAELLDKTAHTQPALLTASVAIWRILQSRKKIQPAFLAGHSLGEYAALVAADALDFQDAILLVALRGQYMQSAVKPGEGAMAAIVGLEDHAVVEICKNAAEIGVVSPANYNSIGQVVIAGETPAVEKAIELAKSPVQNWRKKFRSVCHRIVC